MPTYNVDATLQHFYHKDFFLFFTQRFFFWQNTHNFKKLVILKQYAPLQSIWYFDIWYFARKFQLQFPSSAASTISKQWSHSLPTCAETPVQSTPNRRNKKVQWKCRTTIISKIFYLNTLNKVGCSEILFLRQENLNCGVSKENITQRWNIW